MPRPGRGELELPRRTDDAPAQDAPDAPWYLPALACATVDRPKDLMRASNSASVTGGASHRAYSTAQRRRISPESGRMPLSAGRHQEGPASIFRTLRAQGVRKMDREIRCNQGNVRWSSRTFAVHPRDERPCLIIVRKNPRCSIWTQTCHAGGWLLHQPPEEGLAQGCGRNLGMAADAPEWQGVCSVEVPRARTAPAVTIAQVVTPRPLFDGPLACLGR
jgi:hypothetical protein